MKKEKVFTKQHIVLISLTIFILLFLSIFIQYKYQIFLKNNAFTSKVHSEIKKSLNKKIFEIEGSITSLASFYQASEDFSTSTFSYISKDLIKHYPIIENIIYAQIIFDEDKEEFYKDMYANGFFNFRIDSKIKKEFYLPITSISPDSYKYGKYYGYDISKHQNLNSFFKKLALSSNIGYTNKTILEKNHKLLHLSKATYYGTTIPQMENRIDQTSGYFILSINIESMLHLLEKEFPSYLIRLNNKDIPLEKNAISTKYIAIDLPSTEYQSIYIHHTIYFDDLKILNIVLYSGALLFFLLILIYIFYTYRKHLLYKEFSQLQMIKSEKMAAMGEMIGNISHQWRQPLSAISMLASSVEVENTLGIINKEELNKQMISIVNKTQYLSNTINTFRDFLKEEKELKEVLLEDRIKQAINIVSMVLQDNNIVLKDNIDYKHKQKYTLVVGELDQVIINIINNAKDILLEKKIVDPIIELNLIKENKNIIISIEDNAGGIPDHVMPKIFEPYFTTKHQSTGTGLGLHMSYRIITESLNGKIYAKNTSKGAIFYIELPLN